MKLKKLKVLTFYIASYYVFTSVAVSQVAKDDIREMCRKRVAGMYLTQWNNLETAQNLLNSVKGNAEKINLSIKKEEEKLKKLQSSQRFQDFDDTVVSEERNIQNHLKNLKAAFKQQNLLISENETKVQQLAITESKLNQKISKIMNINKIPVSPDKFILDLVYKKNCPKYQQLCPLTHNDAIGLLEIFEGQEVPEVCKKYSAYKGY